MNMLESLAAFGADTEGALRRFSGLESLYEEYLSRFPADPSMPQFDAALAAGDLDAAFMAAHTLKGVAGTLGLMELYKRASAVTELLRGRGSGRPAELDALARAMGQAWAAAVAAILTAGGADI